MEDLLSEVRVIARRASEYIKSQYGQVDHSQVEEKEMNSLVSYVDKTAERMLVDDLAEVLPAAGFITEEDTPDREGKRYNWVIDPLDGTTNFLMGVPHFSVSVALRDETEVVLGVVIEVVSGEEFYATKGGGAFRNGKPIRVFQEEKLSQALIATGFPYRNDYAIEIYFEAIKFILTKTRGMRRMGSAALDLCYVACGRFGGYYETSLNAWDVAAGALIVTEAGGSSTDFVGEESYQDGSEILACAPQFKDQLIDMISDLALLKRPK